MNVLYEKILTSTFKTAYPSRPGVYLWRGKDALSFPFVHQKVRRRFWLFGPLGFSTSYGFRTVASWPVQFWRVPRDY